MARKSPRFICAIAWPWLLLLLVLPGHAQFETEPHPLDTFLKSVLDFSEPTGIRGTFRFWDPEEQVLWLNWESRSDDRPLFITGWKIVPGEATLAVHPTSPDQIQAIKQLSKGAGIEVVIQLDHEGKRRIRSFQDLTLSRKVPL